MQATAPLKKQHLEVKALFGEAKKARAGGRRRVLDEAHGEARGAHDD
jgi:hypothetical protein